MNSEPNIPTLAPPGAGLPWIELQISRLLFNLGLLATTTDRSTRRLGAEEEKINSLISGYTHQQLTQRMLIKRLPGLEDSSRYWSVAMTLSHVAIVNNVATEVIKQLLQNKSPQRVASTANVKPSAEAGVGALVELESSTQALRAIGQENADLKTSAKYAHPWFGPLDARAWYFLAGFHMTIHRKQIEAIIKETRRL